MNDALLPFALSVFGAGQRRPSRHFIRRNLAESLIVLSVSFEAAGNDARVIRQ